MALPGRSALRALARVGAAQPIADPVPSDDAQFLARKGTAKIAYRVLRRRAELIASGQRPLLRERIESGWKRAIWFHAEAPQIGDALMDLAPRSLLAAHGIGVDLVAPPTLAALFNGDRWLGRVTSDARTLDAAHYDFAIADGIGRKALAAKRVHAARLPWVSIRREYLAYDFQRALFATRRLAELLGVRLDPADERLHARQKLALAADAIDASAADPLGAPNASHDEPPRIALALGGVRVERSYAAWPSVARRLLEQGHGRFALLGSANAVDAAARVRDATSGADVVDLVARTDLHATQQAMARCAAVVCADGGLMHLACTTTTPIVALFDASVDPAWRLPLDFDGASLRSDVRDVSAIAPERVAARVLEVLAVRREAVPQTDSPTTSATR